MKNIHIPEPCTEDWNKMSSSEKGAFCQKCALDVYDFTNKSGDEIRDILTLNIGSRVCGRIEPKQLADLNYDFSAWKINNTRSFQRAWIFTLFVVFGMTLFSCEEDEVPVVKKFQSTAQVILSNETEPDSLSIDSETTQSSGTHQNHTIGTGPPEYHIDEEIVLLGDFAYYEEEQVPVEEIEVELTEVNIVADFPRYDLVGSIISTPRYNEYLIEEVGGSNDMKCEKLKAVVFPNPAVNETTLKINLPEKSKGEIELYALSGQKIRTIHSGRLQKGETTFDMDLSNLETGNYLVIIYVDGKKETVQFSKL